MAPYYDSVEECKTEPKKHIHEDFETWDKALQYFKRKLDTHIHICDDPKTLKLGFSVYPQRECHYLPYRCARNEKLTFESTEEKKAYICK